jgi:hypothetical protein
MLPPSQVNQRSIAPAMAQPPECWREDPANQAAGLPENS